DLAAIGDLLEKLDKIEHLRSHFSFRLCSKLCRKPLDRCQPGPGGCGWHRGRLFGSETGLLTRAAQKSLPYPPPVLAASRLSSRLSWRPLRENEKPAGSGLAATAEMGETWRTHSCVPRRD